jgi:hypothetical protein
LNLKKLKKNLIERFLSISDSESSDPKYTEYKQFENEHMMTLINSISKNINPDELEQLLYDYYYISDDINNLLWIRNRRFKIVQYILLNIAATLQILFKCFDKSAYNSLKYKCIRKFHYLDRSKKPRSQKISKQQAGRQYNRQYLNNPISSLLNYNHDIISRQDIIRLVFNHTRLNEIYKVIDFSSLFGLLNFLAYAQLDVSIHENSTNLVKSAINKLLSSEIKYNSKRKYNSITDSDFLSVGSLSSLSLPTDYFKILEVSHIHNPFQCLCTFMEIVNNPKISINKLFGKEYKR